MWLVADNKESRTAPVAIAPGTDRRWSRIMRMASHSAIDGMNRSGINALQGIYWATGLGCLEDTERFLTEIHTITGSALSPTPFMRSTHNTMAGQMAMVLGSRGPNITVSQHFFSFHLALLHAMLHSRESSSDTVLVGAADERTELLQNITDALTSGFGTSSTIVGEGAASFLFSGERQDEMSIRVVDVWIGECADENTWQQRIWKAGLVHENVTHAFLGPDVVTSKLPWCPPHAEAVAYRNTTGTHHSASAQAFAMAVEALASSNKSGWAIVADRVGDREAVILIERC